MVWMLLMFWCVDVVDVVVVVVVVVVAVFNG